MATARTATIAELVPVKTSTDASGLKEATRAVHTETLYKVVDVADNSTTVYDGPALLFGVYVNTVLSAHTCPIQDSSTDVITLPASLAAGTNLSFPGIRFETSLIVNPNDSGTGSITVAYRPI